jgi:hypothetical protein
MSDTTTNRLRPAHRPALTLVPGTRTVANGCPVGQARRQDAARLDPELVVAALLRVAEALDVQPEPEA